VVVHDLDFVRVASIPAKADSPLVVDADAVLPGAPASEFLEPIARGNSEVVERRGRIHLPQLAKRDPLKVGTHLPDGLPIEQAPRIPVAETANHD
jgi:hypothetical protein